VLILLVLLRKCCKKKKQQYFERKERKNKKKLRFCHLLNSVKRSVVFFEAKKFWTKIESKFFLFLFCSLCSYSKPHNVFVQKKSQNNLPLGTLFLGK